MENGYKLAKESFVSNGEGCGTSALMMCLLHIPVLISIDLATSSIQMLKFSKDVLLIGLAFCLLVTWASSYHVITGMCMYFVLMLKVFSSYKNTMTEAVDIDSSYIYDITLFKGSNVLMTCICILAVDFHVFPRSFAKTEQFGVSLMDIGVGLFVVSSALTSKYARDVCVPTSEYNSHKFLLWNWLLSIVNLLRQRWMVLLMGIGRLVTLKVINYQEHVSEYGLHWNFFVTLYCVWMIADIMHFVASRRVICIVSVLTLIAYQSLLSYFGMSEYLFSDSRVGIIAANKEGIFSLFSYVPLYLLSEYISYTFFFSLAPTGSKPITAASHQFSSANSVSDMSSAARKETVQVTGVSPKMALSSTINLNSAQRCPELLLPFTSADLTSPFVWVCGSMWLGWYVVDRYVQPTSRRLANGSFVLLSLSVSFTLIMVLHSLRTKLQVVCGSSTGDIRSVELMNKHSLAVFLGSNLITGAVNMSINTLEVSDSIAMAILSWYVVMIFAIAELAEYFTHKQQ